MLPDVTVKVLDSTEQEHWLPCPSCANTTVRRVLAACRFDRSWDHRYYEQTEYQIVVCQGCRVPSFRMAREDSEGWVSDPDTGEMEPLVRETLYPPRVKERKPLTHLYYLPPNVASLYKETISALSNGSPVLAGIGVRALVEAVCKEREATGRTLEKQIDDLVEQGVLTSAGAGILHILRFMGNDAAHEAKPHKEEELLTALDVVENLLNSVYLIPGKAGSLPKRNNQTAT